MNYRILDNLENLENLVRNDFLELSHNIEEYYNDNNFHGNLLKLSQLFKVIGYEDFPSGFKLINIKVSVIEDKTCISNQYNQICYEDNGKLFITPILEEVDEKLYYDTITDILNSYNAKDSWKYKKYNINNYKKCNTYIFENQCAVAIKNNEIINVLNSINSSVDDLSLILDVISHGGRLINCYKPDFNYYVRAGFMPVSICKWDDNKAPHNWIINNGYDIKDDSWKHLPNEKLRFHRQDIIFFIYTGNQNYIDFNDWLSKVNYSESYEDAKNKQKLIYKQLEEINEYNK